MINNQRITKIGSPRYRTDSPIYRLFGYKYRTDSTLFWN